MEDKQSSNESEEKLSGNLPVYFRLMDIFLKQVEQSTPLLTTMIKDTQANYIGGVHIVLKFGEALESKSTINVNLIHGVSDAFDKITPIVTEAQLGVTDAVIGSMRQSVQLLRKSITERK
jgi:Na+/serine symporter